MRRCCKLKKFTDRHRQLSSWEGKEKEAINPSAITPPEMSFLVLEIPFDAIDSCLYMLITVSQIRNRFLILLP
jgi:hypothetical protein